MADRVHQPSQDQEHSKLPVKGERKVQNLGELLTCICNPSSCEDAVGGV